MAAPIRLYILSLSLVCLVLRSKVSRPVCLRIDYPSGAYDQFCITVRHLRVYVGYSLRREDGSVVCKCCWSLPAQSFLGPSPVGLATIFYSLRFETSHFVASYDSQGYGTYRGKKYSRIFFGQTSYSLNSIEF
jgi:hypothetical protein